MIKPKRSEEKILANQVAIVTGGANGIGRGIALEMAREGAYVVIADIDDRGSKVTEKMIKSYGGKVLLVHTDVSSDIENDNLVDETLKEFGRVNILVNNTGINIGGGIIDISREDARTVINTNLVGPFFLTQRVVHELIKLKIKGNILFTSSVHGQITQLHPAYSATKAALEMFVRDVALELAQFGIRVNAVAPGAIEVRGKNDRANKHVPLGYSGIPKDIANAMVFIVSDKGSYITGQTLIVDGGFSLAHTHYWIKRGIL